MHQRDILTLKSWFFASMRYPTSNGMCMNCMKQRLTEDIFLYVSWFRLMKHLVVVLNLCSENVDRNRKHTLCAFRNVILKSLVQCDCFYLFVNRVTGCLSWCVSSIGRTTSFYHIFHLQECLPTLRQQSYLELTSCVFLSMALISYFFLDNHTLIDTNKLSRLGRWRPVSVR